MTESYLDARSNPEQAAQLVAAALAPERPNDPNPVIAAPPDDIVTLPAGLVTPDGTVVKTARVRELNGADEEAIARVAPGSASRILNTILERGVVSIGDDPASAGLLDSLLLGDRDALLLGIRRATYGDDFAFRYTCRACGAEQDCTISLRDDIPVKELQDGEREFTVDLKAGTAVVRLPTGSVQKAALKSPDATVAETNTFLLVSCVKLLNDDTVNISVIRRLGLRDRDKLITSIAERICGPQLGEVSLPCASCEENMSVPLTLADIFRLL